MDPTSTYILEETITTRSKSLEELAEIAANETERSDARRDRTVDDLDFDVLK